MSLIWAGAFVVLVTALDDLLGGRSNG